MNNQKIIEGILYLLFHNSPTGDGSGYTLLEIREFLKLNKFSEYFKNEKLGWKKLKNLLEEMENKQLIEERHFGEVLNGRVDYSIENKGTDLIDKKEKELSNEWNINI